jgi:DNA-binding MarR family transcriptional regulator
MESEVRSLREEIRQTKPFPSLELEVFLALLRTSGVLEQKQAHALRAHGLTGTQYNTLRILRGAGDAALTCSDIGERLVTPGPDVTRILDRLEGRGLVRRQRDLDDRRVVRARITEKGLQVLTALDGPIERNMLEILGHMGTEKLKSLLALLSEARHPPA